jgi:hypothetical protein
MFMASIWPGINAAGGIFHVLFPMDAFNNLVALFDRSGRDADVSQNVVVLGALVRRHMRHRSGPNDQNVLFFQLPHFFSPKTKDLRRNRRR